MKKLIVVLMGGLSGEREISFLSAKSCSRALIKRGYAVKEIEAKGYFVEKHKTTSVPLKYHKILRVEKKNIVSMLWIKDCPFPFPLKRPLPENASWAGILYQNNIPWILFDLAEEKKKDTWRKI